MSKPNLTVVGGIEISPGIWQVAFEPIQLCEPAPNQYTMYIWDYNVIGFLQNTTMTTPLPGEIYMALANYGIPQEDVTVERLLTEIKKKSPSFRLENYDTENWCASFDFFDDRASIYGENPLRLLAQAYCAICEELENKVKG